MLADDHIGAAREDPSLPLDPGYIAAFEALSASPDRYLLVGCEGGRVVGTMQLMLQPNISAKGAWRAIIEGVRITADRRSQGLGEQLIAWAVGEARRRGCGVVQLTTDKSRTGAHRFYDRLGFKQSHFGYKLKL